MTGIRAYLLKVAEDWKARYGAFPETIFVSKTIAKRLDEEIETGIEQNIDDLPEIEPRGDFTYSFREG